jgi:hypothetical protein
VFYDVAWTIDFFRALTCSNNNAQSLDKITELCINLGTSEHIGKSLIIITLGSFTISARPIANTEYLIGPE